MKRMDVTYFAYDKCPKCGSKMLVTWNPPGISSKCSSCDYNIASTSFHPIDCDDTIYKVALVKLDGINIETISVISKLSGLNFIQCRKIINNGEIILTGRACDINEKIDILLDKKIKIKITPPWKYFNDPVIKTGKWKIIAK